MAVAQAARTQGDHNFSWDLHAFHPFEFETNFLQQVRGNPPLLSIIFPGREDDFQGDPETGRAAAVLRSYIHTVLGSQPLRGVVEFVIVNYNPPDGTQNDSFMKSVEEYLKPMGISVTREGEHWEYWEDASGVQANGTGSSLPLKVVTIPSRLHQKIFASLEMDRKLRILPFHEYVAKNIGAGFARGKYLLFSNFDSLTTDATCRAVLQFLEEEERKAIKYQNLKDGVVVSAYRWDLAPGSFAAVTKANSVDNLSQLPLDPGHVKWLTPPLQQCFPLSELKKAQEWRAGAPLLEPPSPCTCAPSELPPVFPFGDFLLFPKETFRQVRGFPIFTHTIGHADRVIVCRLFAVGGRFLFLKLPAGLYHMYHPHTGSHLSLRGMGDAATLRQQLCEMKDSHLEYNQGMPDWSFHSFIRTQTIDAKPEIVVWSIHQDG